MKEMILNRVGVVCAKGGSMAIKLEEEYWPALRELDGFGHLAALWWADKADDPQARKTLTVEKPYRLAPERMGIFATRSPMRPNPIGLSVAQIVGMDPGQGMIYLAYIDADDGTPVIDIKPYTPSLDRVENPRVPAWCGHWPKCLERSGEFDWENEFCF